MLRSKVILIIMTGACLLGSAPTGLAQEPPELYLATARAYADAMIKHGRDTYGEVHSPLFAGALDRKKLKAPRDLIDPIEGIRWSDRAMVMVTGSNPMHDQNLYRVLWALSDITQDARYGDEANQALSWFLQNTQSPATGLFPWGEHMSWEFELEAPLPGRDIHEYFRSWQLWEQCYSLAPNASLRFARGLWEHQLADSAGSKDGNFSRHARYSRHQPYRNHEFPRHGGFYIHAWGKAYAHTRDPYFLHAIETLLSYFQRRRHPETGVLPGSTRSQNVGIFSELSYAIDLWDTAARVPEDLARRMRAESEKTDAAFGKLPHEMSSRGRGFLTQAEIATLRPRPDRVRFTDPWRTAYGLLSESAATMVVWERFQQRPLPDYRQTVILAAKRYLDHDPPEGIVLYPAAFGSGISLLVRVHRMTGEQVYLDRADVLARQAIEMFWQDLPLPRASSQHDHYEAITGADNLVVSLLELWSTHTQPDPLEFAWVDR